MARKTDPEIVGRYKDGRLATVSTEDIFVRKSKIWREEMQEIEIEQTKIGSPCRT